MEAREAWLDTLVPENRLKALNCPEDRHKHAASQGATCKNRFVFLDRTAVNTVVPDNYQQGDGKYDVCVITLNKAVPSNVITPVSIGERHSHFLASFLQISQSDFFCSICLLWLA